MSFGYGVAGERGLGDRVNNFSDDSGTTRALQWERGRPRPQMSAQREPCVRRGQVEVNGTLSLEQLAGEGARGPSQSLAL